MSAAQLRSSNTTSISGIPTEVYSKNVPTFETTSPPLATSESSMPFGYGVFISASGIRAGSYSVTSSQDAYRIINRSLLSKAGG